MAIIPARKPYYITFFGQTLTVDLYIYDYDATPPTIGVDDPNYSLKKVSFEDGVDENLRLDISPYIRDYFVPTVSQTINNSGTDINSNVYLKVDAVVNLVTENHTALLGYSDAAGTGTGATQYTRSVNDDTEGVITVALSTFTSVRYTRSDGTFSSYAITATSPYFSMPLVPSTFTLGDSKTLEIEFIGSKNATYNCNVINCDFDPDNHYELRFLNKYGLFESVTLAGNCKENIQTKGETYKRASDDYTQRYNVNGYKSFTVNTGWLSENSSEMVEGLLMSEYVTLTHNTDYYLAEIKSTSTTYKTRKADKMINYEFQIKAGIDIIGYES